MFFMTIIGTGADVLRKFVRGQPIYLDDLAFDNAMQIFLINRYNIRDFGENGLVTGLMNFITPAGFSIFDTLGKAFQDGSELLKLAPAGIKEWFYYRGPNADKRNLKEIQRKMKGEGFPNIQRRPSFDKEVYPRGGGFMPEPFEPKEDTGLYYR